MRDRQQRHRRRLGARVIATVSVLVAAGLLLPGLASGQALVEEAPPAEVVVGQPAPEAADPAPTESPAPAGEAPVEEPAPPPAAGDPGPDLSAAPAPEGEVAPTPAATEPATPAAPALPAVSEPVPYDTIVIAADAPRVQLGAATNVAAAPPALPAAPSLIQPVEALPTPAPVPAVAEAVPPSEGKKAADALAALSPTLFTSDGDAAEPPPPAALSGPSKANIARPETTLAGPSIQAPVGAAPPGSSLLAVLAGYALPGVGGMPATSIMFLIIVGLVVTLAYGVRPRFTERLHLGGLLGASDGHSLAVARPG